MFQNIPILLNAWFNYKPTFLATIFIIVGIYMLIFTAFVTLDNYISNKIRFYIIKNPSFLNKSLLKIFSVANNFFYFSIVFYLVILDIKPIFVNISLERFTFVIIAIFISRIIQSILISGLVLIIEKHSANGALVDNHVDLKLPISPKHHKKHELNFDIEIVRKLGILPFLIRFVIWLATVLIVLQYFDFNISTLVASLGIGSIIFAFAVQNILQDLFASILVYVDKPFEVGDQIGFGTEEGRVVKIGFRSSRIRSKNGEIIVIPNRLLSADKVKNFNDLKKIRCKIIFEIPFGTDLKKVVKIMGRIEKHCQKTEDTRFEHAVIDKIENGKISIEIISYLLSNDFDEFAQYKSGLCLFILDILGKNGIKTVLA